MEDIYKLRGKKLCNKDLYFKKIVNGSNYFIYSVCLDKNLTDCNKILVKVYEIKGWLRKEDVLKEGSYMKRGYELGISPELLGIEECKYDGKEFMFLVMENYGMGCLTELVNSPYYKKHSEFINKKLKELLDSLYDNNINHNDLHSGNFLYNIEEDGSIELKVIDYDNSNELNDKKRNYIIDILESPKKINVE